MDQIILLRPLWDRIWTRRRSIVTLVVTATAIIAAVAFALPSWYLAEAELMPPGADDSNVGLSMFLRGLAIPGVKIPTRVTPADVFMIVLQSRHVNEEIVRRFDLQNRYKKKLMSDAVRELGRHAKFKQNQAGNIAIMVEDRDRERAAAMANAYVELLDRFNREARSSRGRRTRLFIEGRLAEARLELSASEQRLAEYQTRHKTVAVPASMQTAIDERARLFARRATLEVRLGVVRNYSNNSDEAIQIYQELEQLERQIGALPQTTLELDRLLREVRTNEQVFAFLTAQHEDARINEARDTRTVEYLDVAASPERKSRPRRLTMIAATFMLSLMLGMGLAVIQRDKGGAPTEVSAVA